MNPPCFLLSASCFLPIDPTHHPGPCKPLLVTIEVRVPMDRMLGSRSTSTLFIDSRMIIVSKKHVKVAPLHLPLLHPSPTKLSAALRPLSPKSFSTPLNLSTSSFSSPISLSCSSIVLSTSGSPATTTLAFWILILTADAAMLRSFGER